jgi:DNA (cytosine-5)-methyltransferase 1
MASLPRDVSLLPTPNTMDDLPPKTREQIKAHRDEGRGGDRNLREYVLYELPLFSAEDRAHVESRRWGKYAPAIERWEAVLGREAPEPTELSEKSGAHRLSPAFTEWMQGLESGWVTSTGISRKGQLHALGNGVVPAQAALALKILLSRMESPVRSGTVRSGGVMQSEVR